MTKRNLKRTGGSGSDGPTPLRIRIQAVRHRSPAVLVTVRTTRSTVTFQAPFSMPGISGEQPAGTYDLEVDEELIAGIERPAYRRVATLLYLTTPRGTRTCTITADELAAALERDALASNLTATDA